MRNRNFTIKATLAAMACTACVNLSAQQKEYPQPEKMTPGMSEYWTPTQDCNSGRYQNKFRPIGCHRPV